MRHPPVAVENCTPHAARASSEPSLCGTRTPRRPPSCPICLDDLLSQSVFTAECGHAFHFACLLENINHDLANATKCPVCRKVQAQWPLPTRGLANAHPFCTHCGTRGVGDPWCHHCGYSLADTPRARARSQPWEPDDVALQCYMCHVHFLVSTRARGRVECPNGHVFALVAPVVPSTSTSSTAESRPRATSAATVHCTMCRTDVKIPPGSPAGQYACPRQHAFYYKPQGRE
ncbi:hypothetical protein SPRG_12180 [Saprolegnia parasitica CBS 223.65]|uniref:RING-type domain-containing protein n=1 Tax=Saprolegnia parasitica (strain CBS 223.65) TaxID=695850 RepID=A0A067BWX3_SAPPC|nr:hypothetical protein SPRG_12180 [Saprolegnia parasitica CBS 223.65]KDO22753.1 hypothetical protein SPRG_12180 [Saprolegnia parasitica CBS 223.65]|eukprot:XP_012206538.1 hypothetical protein SPRG_12180 [Saprolegnia parasitica CBS 223.65]